MFGIVIVPIPADSTHWWVTDAMIRLAHEHSTQTELERMGRKLFTHGEEIQKWVKKLNMEAVK